MYYRSVNRGLSFTKPGLYTFGLILFVGLTAVATGVNGLYVFLSVGLGGFIVSGLLSERAMRSCTVRSVSATLTDAGTPFEVAFSIENESPWFTVYSMRAMFMNEQPQFRLISKEVPSVASVRMARVPPAGLYTFKATATGLARGEYRRILALQLTTYPFGILEKFKVADVPASLIIAPKVDPEYLRLVRADINQRFGKHADDMEFYAHRPYVTRDSMRVIDWKKSAGRPVHEWAVKVFRSPADDEPVRVEAPWSQLVRLPSEEVYERQLSRVRTTLKALDEAHKDYILDLGEAGVITGRDASLMALAALPHFEVRKKHTWSKSSQPKTPSLVSMKVGETGVEWQSDGRQSSVGRL